MLVAADRSWTQPERHEIVMKRPFPFDSKTILDLQRTAGNQYVAGLLRPSRKHTAVSEPDTVEVVEPEVLPREEPEAVTAAPHVETARLTPPPAAPHFIWPIVIGVLAALCVYVALWLAFPALHRAVVIAAGAACGVGAWYASRAWLYRRS